MPKVVVALLNADQEFQQLQARDARESAARLKLDVEVAFAEGHAVVQIQQLFKHIHAPEAERPAAIVVESATGEGLERVARNAVKAGIGWILVNARVGYVDELRQAHPGLPIATLGADQREVGRIQGRQCRALLPGGGHVLCVQGPGGLGGDRRAARRAQGDARPGLRGAGRQRGLDGGGRGEGGRLLAAAQDRGGLPARRGRLPERLDGGGRAEGPPRAPPGVGSPAVPRRRRAARGRPEDGGRGRPRGHGRHPVEHRPGARGRGPVAAGEGDPAARGAPGRESHPPEDRIRPLGSR